MPIGLKERFDAWREKRRQEKELELEDEVDSAAGEREEAAAAEPPWDLRPTPGEAGRGVW